MSKEEDGREYDPMEDIKRKEAELDQVNLAYDNSYKVLTGEIDFHTLLEDSFKDGDSALMAFDPDSGPLQTELEGMIAWYIESEEYERCAMLRDILEEKFPSLLTNQNK
tara:strand:+ start:214 stop:540 length:327 start_codon:yes stop_codon:yes gene_type:complete